VRAATAMLLPAPIAPRLPPCGSHSRTGGAFLCCSSHFASSLADSRGAPECRLSDTLPCALEPKRC
jgi:hypothetical protein